MQDDLAANVTLEQGKTIADAHGDVFRGVGEHFAACYPHICVYERKGDSPFVTCFLEVVEYACGIASELKGELVENVASGMDTYSIRQPLGVSLVPLTLICKDRQR